MTDGPLNDVELLKLLEEKTPEELTLQELDFLKQRLADSVPLREALLGRLQMEAYLAAALGRIQLSPELIVARAEKEQSRSWNFAILLLLLLICLPILGLTGAVMYNAVATDIAGASHETIVGELPKSAIGPTAIRPESESAKQPAPKPATDLAREERPPTASPEGAPSAPSQSQVETPKASPPPVATPTAPPAPVVPWEETLAQQGNLPTFETIAFSPFDFDKRLPRQADLQPWFEAAPGSNFRLHELDTKQGKCGAIEGIGRLKSPWTEDSVLRIALEHYDKLQMHFYRGDQGVTLIYYEDQGGRWVAYATTRKDQGTKAEELAATATDDDRGRRTELRLGGPVELRWRKGELILSRGDIVLLAAPLAGLPEDVFFEGRAAIQGIALARTSTDPQERRQRPIVLDQEKPGELTWTLRKNAARQPTDPQPTVEKLPNGAIRLAGESLKQSADISIPLPKAGLHEVILELDKVTPGTSVFFGRDKDQVEHTLRFLKNRRDGRTFARIMWIGDEHENEADVHTQKPEACIADARCWVKLLYGCGNLRWWLSADGVHWAQIEHATDGAKGNLATLGLHVVANRPQTEIVLKRIQLRELDAISSLADAEIRNRAEAIPQAANIGGWLTEVIRKQPAGVDFAGWRRACAVRTLGAGADNELANDLLEALLDGPAFNQLPVDRQLAVLDDAMLLVWDLRDGGAMRIGLPHRFLDVGLRAYDEHGLPPWSTVRKVAMSAPVNTWLQAPPPIETSLRWEMIAAVNNFPPEKTLELCRELRFLHQRQLSPLVDWAEATAQRESTGRSRTQRIAVMKDGWRHPLLEDLSKETYNLLNEMQAVLDSEAWDDSARQVTSLDPEAAPGLAPYARDRQLLVSIPVAIRLMLSDYPQLRQSLGENYTALARLRLNRSMTSGDWSEVELAAVQFSGSGEAAEAHRWLGDRALASGWFDRAIVEYSRASSLEPALQAEIAPRVRLASAMLGRDAGQPITQPISFGDTRLDAAQFEALVGEMRGRGQTGVSISPALVAASSTPLSAPIAFTANTRSRLDGPTGDKPLEEVGRKTNQFRIPWVDRQLSVATEGDFMYVANRFQVAAYKLTDGQRVWQSQPPAGTMQRSQQFALIEMRPLVTSQHIYVRQLYTENPLLVCLEKASGKTLWTAKLADKEFFVSDPVIVRGQLGALSIQLQDGQEGLLRWNVLDAESGEVQSQRELIRLRNAWGARACCEIAQANDSLFAVLGGVTISFDPAGQLRWVRKHVVIPAEEDPRWILQKYQQPIIDGDSVFLAQPGVRTIDCVDSSTGAKRWSVTLPDVLGIVGKAKDLLIVQTERDFRGLDRQTGEVRWRRPLENVYPCQILSDNSLLVGTWEKTPGNDNLLRTRLRWLDPTNGKEGGSSIVDQFADADPKVGPFVGYKDRIWTFFGKGQHEPTRDVVELVPKGPAEPVASTSTLASWQSTTPAIAAAAVRVLPKWQLLSAMGGDNTGLVATVHGENDVVGTRSQAGWPVVWARPVNLPAESKHRLRMRVGTDPGMQWKLQVLVNDKPVQDIDVKDETHPDRWKNIEIDLSSAAGQQGWLTISAVHTGGNPTPLYWKTLEEVD
jgi:outer membrane protein assembly factor BamB